ncbi:hypothetical protein BDW62DRAFT_198044 [Aspergillus aurantiobrunneus]
MWFSQLCYLRGRELVVEGDETGSEAEESDEENGEDKESSENDKTDDTTNGDQDAKPEGTFVSQSDDSDFEDQVKLAPYRLGKRFQPFWNQSRGHIDVDESIDFFKPLLELREELLMQMGAMSITSLFCLGSTVTTKLSALLGFLWSLTAPANFLGLALQHEVIPRSFRPVGAAISGAGVYGTTEHTLSS